MYVTVHSLVFLCLTIGDLWLLLSVSFLHCCVGLGDHGFE